MRHLILSALLIVAGPATAADRTVTDGAGRAVEVPVSPQRIVVMHEPLLGLPLIDLGVEVVGSYGRSDEGRFVTAVDFIDTVFGPGRSKPKGIGAVGQIDLEKLKALDPDLIVGTVLDAGKADRLSTVAPVYLQDVGTDTAYGFSVEANLAALVGRSEAFEKREAAYRERLAEVGELLPAGAAGRTYLPVFLTDQINAVGEMAGVVQALEDLGYERLEVERNKAPAAQGGSMLLVPLSPESFGRLDPDLLVLMNSYMAADRDEAGTRAALERILPGWERFLAPARENRILFLDPAEVISPTVASAERTLDAFEAWAEK